MRGSMQRQGQREGLNEKQLEGDPSMCDTGLPLQVLALDSTRTSENLQPLELLNFPAVNRVALYWFQRPVCVHSFPFFCSLNKFPSS